MKKSTNHILGLISFIVLASIPSHARIKPILYKQSLSESRADAVAGVRKICALRVDFQADDNDATTGNGKFLLNPVNLPCNDATFPEIDPAPHNNAYFRDHIRALSNYYRHVSSGKLTIDTTNSAVFPLDNNDVYTLSHKMAYYHPFLKQDSVDIRLTELLVEAVQLADQDDDIDFSQYDIVVVFHAGVGQDFAIDLDPTPYDIPSAYLSSADISDYFTSIGQSGSSILVDGDTHITSGIILPESQNHLLYDNWEDIFGGATTPCDYQIGLNGTFAFMMGFYLGLPGLYNTETGETGVGKFGLMDQGSANLNGLVPSYPSAWERKFMGWDTPVPIKGSQDIKLNFAESGADTTTIQIPVNDDEYFLLENRYSHIRPGIYLDSIQYKQYIESGEKDWPPLIPLIMDSIGAEISPQTGVLLSVPRYDVGLPGSGLLIWHIDESVINANLATNSINNDRDHRGVDLEEGDGAQDLGYESQIIGANVDNGWYFDPWFAGNDGFWNLNPGYPQDDQKRVAFTNSTNPSSRSNDWSYTGVVVDSIGPSEPVMNFRVGLDYSIDGFNQPQFISDPFVTTTGTYLFPVNFDVSDGEKELLSVWDRSDSLFYSSFDENGALLDKRSLVAAGSICPTLITSSDVSYFVVFRAKSDTDSLEVFTFIVNQAGELQNDKTANIVGNRVISNCLVFDNRLIFCAAGSQVNDYYLIAYDPVNNTIMSRQIDFPVHHIISDGTTILIDSPNGEIDLIDADNLAVNFLYSGAGLKILSMGMGYINDNQITDLVVLYTDMLSLVLDIQSDFTETRSVSGTFDSTLAFSDIDGDGKIEIIAKNASQIFAFNEHLKLINNFPVSVPNLYSGESFLPNILTTDVDGDQIPDIIVMMKDVGAFVYNFRGTLIPGFPRALPNSNTEQSVLLENDSGTFILSPNLDGTALAGVYLTSNPLSENAWYCFGGNVEHSYYYPVTPQTAPQTSDGLLNQSKTFNWPNPTKNNRTLIRYFPTSDCDIDITIYDLAGNFIKSFSDSSPLVNDVNEVEWDVGNIANGVYFAVVKASSGGRSESKIVKIMVIH